MAIKYKSLKSFAKLAKKRVKMDWDLFMAVGGYEGSGKSTFSLQFQREYEGKNFSFDKNVIANPEHDIVINKIYDLPRFSSILLDEAIKILYKRGWMRPLQILLNQVAGVCRKENKVVILNIPRFTDLDAYFRKHRVLLWIEVIARGTAVVFMKDWNMMLEDPWHMKENAKMLSRKVKGTEIANIKLKDKLEAISNLKTNFCYVIEFEELEPEFKQEYLNFVRSRIDPADFLVTTKGTERKYRNYAKFYVKNLHKVGKTHKEITELTKINRSTINRLLAEQSLRPVDTSSKEQNI